MKIKNRLKGKVTVEATLTRKNILTAISAFEIMQDTYKDLYNNKRKEEYLGEAIEAAKMLGRFEALLKGFDKK